MFFLIKLNQIVLSTIFNDQAIFSEVLRIVKDSCLFFVYTGDEVVQTLNSDIQEIFQIEDTFPNKEL